MDNYLIIYLVLIFCGIVFRKKIKELLFGKKSESYTGLIVVYIIFYGLLFALFAYIHYHNQKVEVSEATIAQKCNEDVIREFSAESKEVEVEHELLIGEWVFHDAMGTFKERLTFSKKKRRFYEASYTPVSGCNYSIRIVQVRKEGNLYFYSKTIDFYYIHPNGKMIWKCEGYDDEVGNGTYNEEDMKIAYQLQR